ncbi:hypothetical protein R6Q59_028080 [Mikania micrantha]
MFLDYKVCQVTQSLHLCATFNTSEANPSEIFAKNSDNSELKSRIMEVRRMNMKMKMIYNESYENRSSSSGETMASKSKSRSSCFSVESVVLLVGLTASLLILPIVLPPLPPPPQMMLLLPILILGGLMLFAFMPSFSSGARHKGII